MTRYYITGVRESWAVDADGIEHLAAELAHHYEPLIRRPYEVRLDVDGDLRLIGTGAVLGADTWAMYDRLTIRAADERAA